MNLKPFTIKNENNYVFEEVEIIISYQNKKSHVNKK